MLIHPAGYDILEGIYESPRTTIVRARSRRDGQKVILKYPTSPEPSSRELLRLRREFEIGHSLKGDEFIRALRLEKSRFGLILVLEDFRGEPLQYLLDGPRLGIEDFLSLALSICRAVGGLHEQGVIHKDINPSNIVWDREDQHVVLIDFGLSTRMDQEYTANQISRRTSGTLPYSSPEQTGRTSRRLDYRTDFYSLGVTLYRLLTGRLPFQTSDPTELVHAHLARHPQPPDKIRPEVPEQLSRIVMKLLAKAAEDRYQTAGGLYSDLESCLEQFRDKGQIATFPLGQSDLRPTLRISQRLYGRAREVEHLQRLFRRTQDGERLLVLLCGAPGVGKSTLSTELQASITATAGWFSSGKFSPHKMSTPYSAVGTALAGLLQQLLTRSDEEVAMWRRRFRTVLDDDVAFLFELLPDLPTFLEQKPSSPPTDPTEAQHRFRHAILQFLELFCGPNTPLTIFLHDLQWADPASLELIDLVINDDRLSHLLILGTYRDGEIGPLHPLNALLAQRDSPLPHVEVIAVPPLDEEALEELVADSLFIKSKRGKELARVILQKTSGNPYFVHQFLTNLYQEGLLYFDGEANRWDWDLDKIRLRPAADNVVALLTKQLEALDAETKDIVKCAALLGMSFDLETLAWLQESSGPDIYARLQEPLRSGILIACSSPHFSEPDDPTSAVVISELAFAHDRVQEAALSLFDEEELRNAHFSIGHLLKGRLNENSPSRDLFEVVDHLNYAAECIEAPQERLELIGLNLRAANEAATSQAPAHTAKLLSRASALLPADGWSRHGEILSEIYVQQARAELLLGHFDRVEELCLEALDHIDDPVSRAGFFQLLIQVYSLQSAFQEALNTAVEGLSGLGVDFPLKDLDEELDREMLLIEERLGNHPIEGIEHIEDGDHPEAEAAIGILGVTQPPAGFLDRRLLLLCGLKATRLTLDVGIHPGSVTGLAIWGLALCLRGRFHLGYRAGKFAFEMARRSRQHADISHVAFTFGAVILHWTRPLSESLPLFEEGHLSGIRSGNLAFAGLNRSMSVLTQLFLGHPLQDVLAATTTAIAFNEKVRHTAGVEIATGTNLAVRNLLGETDSPTSFSNPEYESAQAFLRHCEATHNFAVAVNFQISSAFISYIYGDSRQALAQLEALEENLDPAVGSFDMTRHVYLHALTLADTILDLSPSERRAPLKKLDQLRLKLDELAASSPQNLLHKALLVGAEVARIRGNLAEAMGLYDRAIEEARQTDFLQFEALANERAGLFWLAQEKEDFASLYLRRARQLYELWQARRKVELLDRQFSHLFIGPMQGDRSTSTSSAGGDAIDLANIVKASEAIASHIDVNKLLPTLMTVALESAGAQRGAFLIEGPDGLEVAVEGESEAPSLPLQPRQLLDGWEGGARSIVRYVRRTERSVVLGRAARDPRFRGDLYLRQNDIRSVLCIPAKEHDKLQGILYMENNLADDAFTAERTEVLKILAGHIAIALNNARLYAELREEKERFRQLAENVNEVFWLMDWPSGRISYISPAYETVWGRPRPPLPISVEDWVVPIADEDRDRVAQALHFRSGAEEFDQTYRIERISGSRRWIRDRGFPIRDANGEVFRIAGVARDITTEYEVAQMKDEFVSVVSHELRTPLTPITGIFSMLSRDYRDELPENLRQMTDLGLRNSRRLIELIDDLLDIQKFSLDKVDFDLEIFDVAAVVEEALELNTPLGEARGITFGYQPWPTPLLIRADFNRLLQVLTNLLSNAVKFSGSDDLIEVEVRRTGDHALISVTDRGPGIAPEAHERIFEKFTQVDSSLTRKHGGTGLGLAIARSIVERLEGRIYLDTDFGKGTTFRVELPLIEP